MTSPRSGSRIFKLLEFTANLVLIILALLGLLVINILFRGKKHES